MFKKLFENISAAIVLCSGDATVVLYENPAAGVLLETGAAPEKTGHSLEERSGIPADACERLRQMLAARGTLSNFETTLHRTDGRTESVRIAADALVLDGVPYTKFCIEPLHAEEKRQAHFLMQVLRLACRQSSAEKAIEQVLALTGKYFAVTQLTLFEILPGKAELCKRQQWRSSEAVEQPSDAHSGGSGTLIVPITGEKTFTGYLTVDDERDARDRRPDEMQLLGDIGVLLALLLERMRRQGSVLDDDSLLQVFSNSFDNLIFISDLHTGEVLFCNREQAEALNMHAQDVEGSSIYPLLERIGRAPEEEPMHQMRFGTGEIRNHYQTWEFRNTENGKWYLARSGTANWADGREIYIETAMEITRRKEHELELAQVAAMDMMTGTYNRSSGTQLVQDAIREAERGTKTSLVFLDLDGLKQVNDCFGHKSGDLFITETIRIIKESVRRDDTVIRWGGDEFLILLNTDKDTTQSVMEKLQTRMKQYNHSGQRLFDLSFSYGVVELAEQPGESVDALISRADQMMYLDKIRKRCLKVE